MVRKIKFAILLDAHLMQPCTRLSLGTYNISVGLQVAGSCSTNDYKVA